MGLGATDVLKEIQRQGWELVRRTRHGILLEKNGVRQGLTYPNHPSRHQLGSTQLRMLSKMFDLNPPLIADGSPKETAMPLRSMMGMKPGDWAPRVTAAMKSLEMPDSKLATLMGRTDLWVRDLKKGRTIPTKEEQQALFNIFGITRYQALATKWFRAGGERVSTPPPLKPAPWVQATTNGRSVTQPETPKKDPIETAAAANVLQTRGEAAIGNRVMSMKDVLRAAETHAENARDKPLPDAQAASVSVPLIEKEVEKPKEEEVNPKQAPILQQAEALSLAAQKERINEAVGAALKTDSDQIEAAADAFLKPVRELLVAYMSDNLRLTQENARLQQELDAKIEMESALDLMEETLAKYRKKS